MYFSLLLKKQSLKVILEKEPELRKKGEIKFLHYFL